MHSIMVLALLKSATRHHHYPDPLARLTTAKDTPDRPQDAAVVKLPMAAVR